MPAESRHLARCPCLPFEMALPRPDRKRLANTKSRTLPVDVRADKKRARVEMRSLLRQGRSSVAGDLGELSFLSVNAVAPPSQQKYKETMELAKGAARRLGLALDTSDANKVDQVLCDVADLLFFDGEDSHVGHTLLAAWLHFFPEFGRFGPEGLPRYRRALRGWDRLAPGGSRLPEPWPVWASLALWFVRNNLKWMGLCVIVMFSTYGRPGEIADLMSDALVPPARNISKYWAIVIRPEEQGRPTKVGKFNDVVLWDSADLQWVSELFRELKVTRGSGQRLWPFTENEFVRKFRLATAELGVPWLTRYHARHSGASWDALQSKRSLLEIQQRGRWSSHSSVARYEKGGRLQMQWSTLDPRFRQFAEASSQRLRACFLASCPVPMPLTLPRSRCWRTSSRAAAASRSGRAA